jgi:phosphatidylinositol-3-phosphatase
MRTRFLALAAAVALLFGVPSAVIACTSASSAIPRSVASGGSPCGTQATAPTYRHVVWIWMENHSYNSIIGSSQAPYINSLARKCGLATNYHNISHPSLPNYVGATSGLGYTALQKFKPDCDPVTGCVTHTRGIFGQGESWRAYQESMPSNCRRTDSGEYAVHHNPPPYFTTLKGCSKHDVPYSQLASDLASKQLPAFSFITPNMIDDMHDGTVADGDSWLAKHLSAILNSPQYRNGSTAVFITWDEGEGGSAAECATNTTDIGCRVVTIVVSPSTKPGTRSARLFNHYSLLGTAEQLLHLPKLGRAGASSTMTSAFHL